MIPAGRRPIDRVGIAELHHLTPSQAPAPQAVG
jgi:hypothetical protein